MMNNRSIPETTPTGTYENISDESGLFFRNPDLKDRQIGKIRLANGLNVYIISDPKADQSSASVAVQAGSWNDPQAYPGMAHFCEHMLFLGTQKYPDHNLFSTSVSDAGGIMNAFTASDRTVYMFSSKEDKFLANLDQFAHFFIDPIFNPDFISRELHAVDQEFTKNLENDAWREFMVFKELANPEHPNHKFSTGNAQTLGNIPQSALLDWHRAHYSADKMHLFVYSSLPLEQLKLQASTMFSSVPIAKEPIDTPKGPILSPSQFNHIAYVKPIQNRQALSLMWELPEELAIDPSKPAELIAYALGRGQEFSLFESLKKEQLVDAVIAEVEQIGGPNHSFFTIQIYLAPKAMGQIQTITARCFEALALFQKKAIPSYLFDEKNQIATLQYEYQSRKDAFQMAADIGRSLPDEPLATYPQAKILSHGYNPEKVSAVLNLLKPTQCAITLTAPPSFSGVNPDKTEQWFQAQYAVRPISPDWLAAWNQPQITGKIQIAQPNPFLPTDLSSVPIAEHSTEPMLLSEVENGIAYYCRAPEFSAPEAALLLHIRSPEIAPTAKSTVLLALYLDHLTDELHPTLAAAESAGLSARFNLDKLRLNIQVDGFSEKAPQLLDQILKKLTLAPPTKEQFDLYFARHEKIYANAAKDLPVKQAIDTLYSLLSDDRTTQEEKLKALKTISYEEYVQYQKTLFETSYQQAFFAGNLSLKQAESSWIDIQHALNRSAYPKNAHVRPKVLLLSSVEGGPFSIHKEASVQGNGAVLVIDEGPFSFESRALQDTLSPALHDAFFNELRTKQKTAYIAKSDPLELEGRLFHLFLVQSGSHQPEDLLYRFELFFEEYLETLPQSIPLSRFEELKTSAVHSIETRYRSLTDKALLWDILAFEKEADFHYLNKRIDALQSLSYDRFLSKTKELLGRKNAKRLAVLVEGKLTAPFSYEPIAPDQLREKADYLAAAAAAAPAPPAAAAPPAPSLDLE